VRGGDMDQNDAPKKITVLLDIGKPGEPMEKVFSNGASASRLDNTVLQVKTTDGYALFPMLRVLSVIVESADAAEGWVFIDPRPES